MYYPPPFTTKTKNSRLFISKYRFGRYFRIDETPFPGTRPLQRVGDLIVPDTTANIKRTTHPRLCFRRALRDEIAVIEIRLDEIPSSRPLVPSTIASDRIVQKRNCRSAVRSHPGYSFWRNTGFHRTFCSINNRPARIQLVNITVEYIV